MNNNPNVIQNYFLDFIKNNKEAYFYLENGFKVRGKVIGYDTFCVAVQPMDEKGNELNKTYCLLKNGIINIEVETKVNFNNNFNNNLANNNKPNNKAKLYKKNKTTQPSNQNKNSVDSKKTNSFNDLDILIKTINNDKNQEKKDENNLTPEISKENSQIDNYFATIIDI